MIKKFFTISIMFLIFGIQESNSQLITDNDMHVRELMSKMTLEQKIGQLWQQNYRVDTITHKMLEWIKSGKVGSLTNVKTKIRNELQKVAIEQGQFGIPLIFGRDVIHGYRTIFPIPLAQSCSWNMDLIEQSAKVAAKEASSSGIDWTFAPMIDITMNPKWGRVAETSGEDSYLTSQIAKAMVKGFQGDNLSDSFTIASCAKHFAGYGMTEDGRDYNSTWIPKTRMRNLVFPPFQAAIDQGVASIMVAFNEINGIPASGNEWLYRDVLRSEWQYTGLVVSDWESITKMIPQGFAENKEDACLKAINTGIDMEMQSDVYPKYLKELVEKGLVPERLIDEACFRVLKLKYELGLFERPYAEINPKNILTNEHLETAQRISRESMVLLKNDGVLPLKRDSKIALIGPLANSGKDQMGTWSLDGKAEDMITPYMAFNDSLANNFLYAEGLAFSRDKSTEKFKEALAIAKKSDIVVLCLGEESILSGEAKSRAFLNLPGAQKELVEALYNMKKPIVTVIMAGRPLVFNEVAEMSDAVLYAWHPGIMGGPALFDLLFGNYSPSGKLSISFPRTEGQIPIYYHHTNTGCPPTQHNMGIPTGDAQNPVGYSSNFLDVSVLPAYPFGYGLTYSHFNYSEPILSDTVISMNDTLSIKVMIKNAGNFIASEIVQLYVQDITASLTRPVKELKGFQKVRLESNQEAELLFTITPKELGFFNADDFFIIEKGRFNLWVGPNSQEGTKRSFKLDD